MTVIADLHRAIAHERDIYKNAWQAQAALDSHVAKMPFSIPPGARDCLPCRRHAADRLRGLSYPRPGCEIWQAACDARAAVELHENSDTP